MIRLLEKHGANLNGLNVDGETPLIIAVCADREDVVRLLLELGADVDVPSVNGAPPLYYSLAKRCRAVMPAIFLRKPNVNFLTQESESILHAAVRFGELEIVTAAVNQLRVYQGGRVQLPPLLPSVIERFSGASGVVGNSSSSSTAVTNINSNGKDRQNDDEDNDDDENLNEANGNNHDRDPSSSKSKQQQQQQQNTNGRDEATMLIRKATLNPNSFDDNDQNYRRWANTSSLCDAKSTSASSLNVCPIGIAIHNAINPASSVGIGTKSSQVAHYLACVRTDMMLEEHLDIPRY